jgi:pimeloyl-[acyl-carrier protein] methyl ester esterase
MSKKLNMTTVGQGPQLVFLHGWGVNSGVWAPLIALLQDSFCITTMDLPGYGENQQHLPVDYNLRSVSEMLGAALPANAVLVGWSLGGLIAQQIAILYPHKVANLVMVCTSPKFSKSDDWPGIEAGILDVFSEKLSQDFNHTLNRFLAIQAMGSSSAKDDIKNIKQAVQQYPSPSNTALRAGLQILKQSDLRLAVQDLRIPCHLILGQFDSLVPATLASHMQVLMPQLKIEVMAKASHAPFISHTQAFAEMLLKKFS